MSGIVGLVCLDGAAVDRRLLQQMTELLAFRGPDAREIWSDGPVGLGHALLHTTFESPGERQPASLDGQVWITADARVDAREELRQKLEAHGRRNLDAATDAELILHAYHLWGEACLEHLLGDFAFAIWDARERRLFCARDHFGVKPFYYAQAGQDLIFSNTIECVRSHPAVSDELNDLAIADFLLFDKNLDLGTTAFAGIQRLPPAHALAWSGGTLRPRRYWTLPVDGRIRYRRAGDYVEHLRGLLRSAVRDRLRTRRVGVLMSGGLDSTSVAATAHQLLSLEAKPFDLRAYTITFDGLFRDEEGHYAGLVAQALGIPIHLVAGSDYRLYERFNELYRQTPEPLHNPLAVAALAQFEQAAAHSRVVLSGLGGDNLFYYEWQPYVRSLLEGFRWGRLLADVARYVWYERRIPLLHGLAARMKRLREKKKEAPAGPPPWLNQAFSARLNLASRREQAQRNMSLTHAIRPQAYRSLHLPLWPYNFEISDPGVTGVPVEVRYPLFDLRLVNYCLAIPPLPWCVDKRLLRLAMRGVLPTVVFLRPKAPLAGDPILELLRRDGAHSIGPFDPTAELAGYVNRDAIPELAGEQDSWLVWVSLRPLTLNHWLRQKGRLRYKPRWEDPYEPGAR